MEQASGTPVTIPPVPPTGLPASRKILTRLRGKVSIGAEINHGSFGKVSFCQSLDENGVAQKYAIKEISLLPKKEKSLVPPAVAVLQPKSPAEKKKQDNKDDNLLTAGPYPFNLHPSRQGTQTFSVSLSPQPPAILRKAFPGIPHLMEGIIMNSFHHPYLASALATCLDNTEEKLYFVQHLAATDLAKYTRGRPLPLQQFRRFAWMMSSAVAFLHEQQIVHADIKAANALVEKREEKSGGKTNENTAIVKLGDFTLSSFQLDAETPLTHWACTGTHRPPEIIVGGEGWTYSLDIWSLGCTFLEMITGTLLFKVCDCREDYRAQLEDWFLQGMPLPALGNSLLFALIKKMLAWRAKERPTIAEVLADPFFREEEGKMGEMSKKEDKRRGEEIINWQEIGGVYLTPHLETAKRRLAKNSADLQEMLLLHELFTFKRPEAPSLGYFPLPLASLRKQKYAEQHAQKLFWCCAGLELSLHVKLASCALIAGKIIRLPTYPENLNLKQSDVLEGERTICEYLDWKLLCL